MQCVMTKKILLQNKIDFSEIESSDEVIEYLKKKDLNHFQ